MQSYVEMRTFICIILLAFHVVAIKFSDSNVHSIDQNKLQKFLQYLEQHDHKQSDFVPCIFIGHLIIFVVYVDDTLLYAKKGSVIDLIAALTDVDILIC